MADSGGRARLGQVSRDRLQENLGGLFTSDLTVNEYLLVADAGFEPLGLVVGSSIYHVGYQRRQFTASHELTVLSQALYHARELAMERMTAEAEELGAHGVVGVRLQVKGFQSAATSRSSSPSAPRSGITRTKRISLRTAGRSRVTCRVRISGRC